MNENEQKMNRFLFAFVKILEWLIDGAHISKNQIHYIVNEAAISCNVGVTTFGPPCITSVIPTIDQQLINLLMIYHVEFTWVAGDLRRFIKFILQRSVKYSLIKFFFHCDFHRNISLRFVDCGVVFEIKIQLSRYYEVL